MEFNKLIKVLFIILILVVMHSCSKNNMSGTSEKVVMYKVELYSGGVVVRDWLVYDLVITSSGTFFSEVDTGDEYEILSREIIVTKQNKNGK